VHDLGAAVNPRLLAVSGPLRESTFVLVNDEVTVGRDGSNQLAISDPSLSRRHCVLVRDAEGYKIRDLGSRNGTFVNGLAVQESRLRHGDQISAGDSVFVLLLRDETALAASDRVQFDDRITQATEQLRPQDALYLQPERILRELPETERLTRNLNALLEISRVVHAIRDAEQLQAQVLASIFEVVPAERGAIFMDSREDEFQSVFVRNREEPPSEPLRVSRTITRQVMQQGVAVLGSDIQGSEGFQKVESLVASTIRSLLCVPLMMFQKVTGCIYLDTSNPASRFDQDHLQLVTALAGIAAVALENARRLQWLQEENLRLITEINLEHQLVGESAGMKQVYSLLARVAPADSTVLIQGESGTGKELAARAIHRNSPRAEKPFIVIDCGAMAEGLIESELFGHEKGSFTGAVAQRKGKLEMAHGGVVFLDEVGELSLTAQVKLLRVLQERKIERLGGEGRLIPVNIRLVAATNKNLEEEVKAGLFRLDLFYRLNVVGVIMPPLRERRDDIPVLAEYFVRKASKKCKVRVKKISPEAMACLSNYDWPGNVRELENVIERALVLTTTEMISPEDLPELILEKDPPPGVAAAKYHAAVKALKQQLILNALDEAKGNYTEAARILGVHPNYLHRLIRNLDLKETIKAGGESRGQNKKFA
jgi:transcriptional regulator with GAF, ATPase, and Fis domain